MLLQHEKFQSEPGSRVGTPAYLAPEVILTTRGKTYDGKVHAFKILSRVLVVEMLIDLSCSILQDMPHDYTVQTF